ncbi:MAG: beta-N-acetylhexosaminidase [Alphaproteobacteria bacterium]|nr:beta-N-acetylhexosaminidase [Alphaproteobacteria bacterium]
MSNPDAAPKAVIFGCAGTVLSADERRFLAAAEPLGFILFERNCAEPAQLRALVAALRDAVGRAGAPVLIDQEGGRVTRLKPPRWRARPAPARFAELARHDLAAALEAARLNARLMAHDLTALGIDVDCAPVADVVAPGAHDVIGDRALGSDPETVAALAGAVCEGLLEGGVLPVIKHLPGHGRARVDSHHALPVVEASRDELRGTDFVPFQALAHMPWAMTAHVVYSALDAARPATQSPRVINEVIRGEIGFAGVLASDDLSMAALTGSLAERARGALAAGCDLALHCSGELAEMVAIADAVGPLSAAAQERRRRAAGAVRAATEIDPAALAERLGRLLSRPLEAHG